MAGTIRFVDKNGNEIGRLTDFDNPDSITQLANKMDEAYFSGRVSDIKYLSNMVNLVRVGYSLTGPQQVRIKRIRRTAEVRLLEDIENGTLPKGLMGDLGIEK